MVRLLAIDPGPHFGWAAFRIEQTAVYLYGYGTSEGSYNTVTDLVRDVDRVVLESFQAVRVSSGPMMQTIKLIGAVEAMCYLREIDLVTQIPGVKHGYAQEAHNLMKPRKVSLHCRDAIAHALRYLETRFGSDSIRNIQFE